ncbi:MAG: hypothetical protein ACF8PN_13430 [Phycisphaerales bacterium]
MTRQANERLFRLRALLSVAAAALILTLAIGCEEEPPPPPPPPPPAPKPQPPTVEEISALVPLDSKVDLDDFNFHSERTREQMVASFHLLNGFARADEDSLRSMIDSTARATLDQLIDEGEWNGLAERIERVNLMSAMSPDGSGLTLNFVIEGDGILSPQTWVGRQRGDSFIFSPEYTMPEREEAAPVAEDAADDGADGDDERIRTPRDDDDPGNPRDPRRRVPRRRDAPIG